MHLRQALAGALKPVLGRVRERPVLVGLVGVLVLLLAFFVAVMDSGDPAWAYRLFGVKEKFRVLEFVGIAMGGVLLAIGAEIANRRAVALEGAAKAQAGAARAQADANKGAEDGRRQERLKNAIEHLGHASDSVRLGGAYELFHLAQDTEDLRQTVLDILCAHIRRTTGEAEYLKKHGGNPSEEIQSLLTLLFVREYAIFEDCRVDLQGSWLNGAKLMNARLQRASFIGARLQGAILIEAHLQGADLTDAHLQGAELFDAHLQGAVLSGAHLQGAVLSGAQLQGADLSTAHMQGAVLSGAYLQGAKLFEAHLQGAYLRDAFLQGAELSGVHLQGTICSSRESPFQTHIRAGIDRESDLSGAIFAGGLSHRDVDSFVEGVPDEVANKLRRRLEPHIDKRAIHGLPESSSAIVYGLPENSGAITGTYTKEEAERWIAEYEEAMGERPEAGG